MPSRDGDEGNGGGVVADLLDVGAHFLGDFLKTSLAVGGLGGVHLVDSNDELLYTQGEGQQGVLTGLAVLGDTSLELTNTSSNDQHSAVSLKMNTRMQIRSKSAARRSLQESNPHVGAYCFYLGGTSDHVLDEVSVSRGINDGHVVLAGLELPQSDIDGDTTLTLSLQFVQHPGVLEGALSHLNGKKLMKFKVTIQISTWKISMWILRYKF